MTGRATPLDIREWAAYLRSSADDLERTIPEVEKLSGKVKVPGKTFARLQEEVERLLVAIETEAVKARRRLPFDKKPRPKSPKRRDRKSENGNGV